MGDAASHLSMLTVVFLDFSQAQTNWKLLLGL